MKNLAAIDIGTNSFHLIVVKIDDSGNFEIIDREREVIRLNEGNTSDIKILNPDAVERGIEALKTFKGIAETHQAKIRAVATSAVREASNRDDFIQKVYEQTGITVEVVSGFEEARLIYLGILKAVPFFDDRILCLDIGGGSTEFLVGEKGDIIYSNSLKLGAVRLSNMFFPDGIITKQSIIDCKKWVEGEIFPVIKSIEHLNFSRVIGSSGTIQAAGSIINALKNRSNNDQVILNNFSFSSGELERINRTILSKKNAESRKKIAGLESKRADIIPAGIIILNTIIEQLKADTVTVSGYALREGIIIDSLHKFEGKKVDEYLHNIRLKSINRLAQSSNYDLDHANFVAELSLSLFDQLKELHQLDDTLREYLYAAAVLHDIGYHIAHNFHHKHSYYIIRNSDLMGFTDTEISLIANVARYHRKSHPKKSHLEFNVLNEEQKELVRKLSAILRVADSLDRKHSGSVKKIECEISPGKVELKVDSGKEPIEIELWSLERRKGLFEEVFNRSLSVSLV